MKVQGYINMNVRSLFGVLNTQRKTQSQVDWRDDIWGVNGGHGFAEFALPQAGAKMTVRSVARGISTTAGRHAPLRTKGGASHDCPQ